jgi:hypothetical protein
MGTDNKKNSKTAKNQPEEQLLFDIADATPFRHELFNDSPIKNPEIDLLTVKAINRVRGENDIIDETELEIEHGMMILNSHRKELAELETLEEGKVSNKKIAVIIIILLFFIAFIVIMFVVFKMMEKPTHKYGDTSRISYNNG